MLTPQQNRALSFIASYTETCGSSPSYQTIAANLGLNSKSGVHRLVTGLEERGYIKRLPFRRHAIEVLKMPPRPTPKFPQEILDLIRLSAELCDAVDAAGEDIGGHRGSLEILRDLGPATDAAMRAVGIKP
jgi:SOS-response transcriptional repressor LexA